MAGFFAGLVGGVFLRALVQQHMAQRGREVQRALLAMQDRGERIEQRLIHELRAQLGRVELGLDVVGLQGGDQLLADQGLGRHVPGGRVVDVLRVQRIPEMVVGRGDDLVERRRARVVAVEIEHRLKVVRRYGLVDQVLGDVAVSRHVEAPMNWVGKLQHRYERGSKINDDPVKFVMNADHSSFFRPAHPGESRSPS